MDPGPDAGERAAGAVEVARVESRVPPAGQPQAPSSDHESQAGQGDGKETPSEPPADPRSFIRRHPVGVGIAAIVLVAVVIAGVLWYLEARHFEETDDAFIDARQFSLAPKVAGYVVDVSVTDNQHVETDAPIARIDTRDYDVALAQAEAQVQAGEASIQSATAQIAAQQSQIAEAQAQVQQNEAALTFARDESQRAQDLVQRGAGTLQRAQQTESELTQAQANLTRVQATLTSATRQVAVLEAQRKSAEASLAQAQAQRDQARLNLGYTNVTAPQSGRVVRLTAAKGQLVQAGQALSVFVPDEMWVTANFKETQLADMRPGQPVDMTIDAYPGRIFQGHVASVQSGSGTAFSLLPAQNATGNYVKVVQRLPVRIRFKAGQRDADRLAPGMSVEPKVMFR